MSITCSADSPSSSSADGGFASSGSTPSPKATPAVPCVSAGSSSSDAFAARSSSIESTPWYAVSASESLLSTSLA
ncbi:hypothetical protein [Natronoarchaeum sp. GCM10025703]|uniref:hypothetical protein n=1 Tax=Natronoarchaeum sp. GCM10025703 TaxID=3252685 RepID=UPI003A93FE7C